MDALLYSEEKIKERVKILGSEITKKYKDKNLHIVIVATGGFVFAADLVREIKLLPTISFCQCSSYLKQQRGRVLINLLPNIEEFAKKSVLIIDDICDSGSTLFDLVKIFSRSEAVEINSCTLIVNAAAKQILYRPCFWGFETKNQWVYGYGMDDESRCRNLKGIYVKK